MPRPRENMQFVKVEKEIKKRDFVQIAHFMQKREILCKKLAVLCKSWWYHVMCDIMLKDEDLQYQSKVGLICS